MKDRLAIAMFVDACGWGVVGPRPWFLGGLDMDHRQPVTSIFGYSSACVPAILTGLRPDQNDHWSTFYYAPDTSPFAPLTHLRHVPSSILDRGRVRGWLSKLLARAYGFSGYFQLYNLPFDILPLFDYAEKHDIFRPGGINRGASIFDELAQMGLCHHVSNWRRSEAENVEALAGAVRQGDIRFAFLYTAGLDALMHEHSKDAPQVDDKLRWYQAQIEHILTLARARYREVRVAVFSDHGMATVARSVDLMPRIAALRLAFGTDYAAVYDSTMLRFWFLRPHAEAEIRAALPDDDDGRWVTQEELVTYGTYWPDGKFGHGIYALEPGVIVNPCHMGTVAPKGMHGYRPDHADSMSALVANFAPITTVEHITDLKHLMREMADWAAA